MSRLGAKKGLGFHCARRRKRRARWLEPKPILPDEIQAVRDEIARESARSDVTPLFDTCLVWVGPLRQVYPKASPRRVG